ncbi:MULTISPECIES: hypothetical protein [Clostridium]|uniref:Uncharacterized protein n=1 Tax=Clostridium lapidicellarium TaxID=3240931 RepID=A0ABV4E0S3_9CLOT|nr:hypothetical protein [Clostridiales bacterium]
MLKRLRDYLKGKYSITDIYLFLKMPEGKELKGILTIEYRIISQFQDLQCRLRRDFQYIEKVSV